jgi:hypothetical protein
MRIAWVLGWAVPETWFARLARAAFPQAEHDFFAASPIWLAKVSANGPWDAIAGHSLGALLMLKEAAAVSRLAPRVTLLAPVLAFPAEAGLGGRIALTQVRYLTRWLKTDPTAALADFYARAGMSGCEAGNLNAPAGLLQWGLERLMQDRVDPPLPMGWRGYVGVNDALLDARELVQRDPKVTCVAGATHHPEALIRAWAADFA